MTLKSLGQQGSNDRGYTLLEVMLFLAISSALALIAFAGLGPRLRNVRFTDATKGLQSDITNQIMNAQVGQNRRSDGYKCVNRAGIPAIEPKTATETDLETQSGSSANCVINGKLAKLEQNQIVYYSVVSFREPVSTCTTPQDNLPSIKDCFKPQVLTDSATQPVPLAQAYKNGMKVAQAAGSPSTVWFGYLQNPNGTNKYYITNDASDIDTNFGNAKLLTSEVSACLVLNERRAMITFKPGLAEPQLNTKGCS